MAAAKPSSAAETGPPSPTSYTTPRSNKTDPELFSRTLDYLADVGMAKPIPKSCDTNGFISHFYGSFIKVHSVQRGSIHCTFSVKPSISNVYGTLHGGSVGSLTEMIATACARTVVAEDKELFLGEMSVSYLSGVPTNEEVLVEASVVKSGRNLTVVSLEFKLTKSGILVYLAHATFYNIRIARL
ncbi:uncharacterized protein LOC107485565 [Arachis duranensis]|uniref:Uncharacterized protein LOC107485565 n=1 Tax=Arachis duranensis TaxID=130453 RepID=A0A6P4D3K7_ARADU|nr:uncharacterized protein LOC107485565 [Arachis duranensis]